MGFVKQHLANRFWPVGDGPYSSNDTGITQVKEFNFLKKLFIYASDEFSDIE